MFTSIKMILLGILVELYLFCLKFAFNTRKVVFGFIFLYNKLRNHTILVSIDVFLSVFHGYKLRGKIFGR